MKVMKRSRTVLACILASTFARAFADFTYQETTQITGGSMLSMMKFAGTFSKQAKQASEPVVSSVTVKGNRMMSVSKDRTEIVDLDADTITVMDHAKKQYTTMTFEQMRQQMQAALAKANSQQYRRQPSTDNDAPNVDVKFNVKVRSTGASRDVAGLNTKESIMTMTMDATDQKSGGTGSLAITNDLFLAPDIPGYGEVRDFYQRYSQKMETVTSGAMNIQTLAMAQQPAAGRGMAEMIEEMSKLQGIPVLQIMRMGTTTDGKPLPAASESPLPTSGPSPTGGSMAKTAIMESLPFGGFSKRKKQNDPAPDANSPQPSAAVLIESNTELTKFSTNPVDVSQFKVPGDYKEVAFKQLN